MTRYDGRHGVIHEIRNLMGRTGHRLTGIAAGCLSACAFWPSKGDWSLAAIPAGYFGGTAPDWLEIAHAEYSTKYQKWMRKSVIPHRTITHWWLVWVALSALLMTWPFPETGALLAVRMAGTGFVAGAWMHLLMDIPNPTGIPMATPYAKSRFGFGWWKSGNVLEPLAGMLMVAGAGALLFGVAHHSTTAAGVPPFNVGTLLYFPDALHHLFTRNFS